MSQGTLIEIKTIGGKKDLFILFTQQNFYGFVYEQLIQRFVYEQQIQRLLLLGIHGYIPWNK